MSAEREPQAVIANFPRPVTVIATRDKDGSPLGATTNAVAALPSDPARLLFALPIASDTLAALKQSGEFTVSVLSERQRTISSRFAISDGGAGITGLELAGDEAEPPFVVDSVAHFRCSVTCCVEVGDQELVVARIVQTVAGIAEANPLLFFRGGYAQLHSEAAADRSRSARIEAPSLRRLDASTPTVAIVGGGFSGALTAVQLLRRSRSTPIRISIVERRRSVGRGLAYSTPCLAHKLNVPAGQMSAFPEEPDHFLRWVRRRDPSVGSGSFVPRFMYGDYIEETLAAAEADADIRIDRIEDEVTEVTVLDVPTRRARLTLRSGRELNADWVVVASGHAVPSDPPGASEELLASHRYIGDPWDLDRLGEIDDSESVVMLGSGLTMVDTALMLGASSTRPIMDAVSRNGWLPRSHREDKDEPLLELLAETTAATDRGGSWRSAIDSLRPWTNQIWHELKQDEREWFVSKLSRLWEVHRHRMAPEVARAVDLMRREGSLRVTSGELVGATLGEAGVELTIDTGGDRKRRLEASRLINCTGPAADVTGRSDPLLKNLLTQGLARPDSLHLGVDVDEHGAIIDRAAQPSSMIFVIGPLRKGALWETTAVPELRVQATNLANLLVDAAAVLNPEAAPRPARKTQRPSQ
jgi:uncharacterized NAD(P)/FAD-binding protein YdhS/flavin reductase (DIM6/NTAB) family NADH-FMN oxidoreductase RutF